MNNELGLCQCGCGQKTSIAKQNHTRWGWTKGQPVKCIRGHRPQNYIGLNNPNWKGGKRLHPDGYVLIWKPDHPRANKNYVMEHILITEEVLGKLLPEGAVVHHVNENRSDNRKENLVICKNNAYHQLLHQRMRAFRACGHASWRKCPYCKEYDDTENLVITTQNQTYHNKCENEYRKLRYREKVKNG